MGSELNSSCESYNNRENTLTKELCESMKSEIDNLTQINKNLTTAANSSEESKIAIDAIESEKEVLKVKLSQVEETNSKLTNELLELQNTISNNISIHEELSQKIASKEEECSKLQSLLDLSNESQQELDTKYKETIEKLKY